MKKTKKYLSGMIIKTLAISAVLCVCVIVAMVILDKKNAGSYIGVNLNHSWFSLIGTCISALVSINVPIYVMVKTLRYQKENADRELRLRIMPIFKYEFLFDEESPEEKRGGLTMETKDGLVQDPNAICHFGYIKITNVGAGHAKECIVNFRKDEDLNEQSIWFGSINMQKSVDSGFVILTERTVTSAVHHNFKLQVKYKDYAENEYAQTIVVGCGHREHYDEDNHCTIEPYIIHFEPDEVQYLEK